MCRSTDMHGFHHNEQEPLKIKAFFLMLSVLKAHKPLPDSLTLVFLPRMNGNPLEIDEFKVGPDSSGFVTLHRIVSADMKNGGLLYGSRDPVRASEGVRFEVYLGDEKVLKGIFRKDEGEEWKMECNSGLERKMVGVEVSEAEVWVAMEGHAAISEKVQMAMRRQSKARGFQRLEDIPEERELDTESDGCCCSGGCGDRVVGLDGRDYEKDDEGSDWGEEMETEMEIERVRWAIDVGIWVMCLGVGYLVSKASSKNLRRRRML